MFGFEYQSGLTSKRAKGLWETKIPLLKSRCTNPLTLSLSSEAAIWKAPGPYVKKIHCLVLWWALRGRDLWELSLETYVLISSFKIFFSPFLGGLILLDISLASTTHSKQSPKDPLHPPCLPLPAPLPKRLHPAQPAAASASISGSSKQLQSWSAYPAHHCTQNCWPGHHRQLMGLAHPLSHPQQLQYPHNRRVHETHTGDTPEASDSGDLEDCSSEPHRKPSSQNHFFTKGRGKADLPGT